MADSFNEFEGVKPPGNVEMFSSSYRQIINVWNTGKSKQSQGDVTTQPDQTNNQSDSKDSDNGRLLQVSLQVSDEDQKKIESWRKRLIIGGSLTVASIMGLLILGRRDCVFNKLPKSWQGWF